VNLNRREFMGGSASLALFGSAAPCKAAGGEAMHGLIGKMNATPGQRDLLISILLEGTAAMPGCLSYVVAKDSKDENGIWISEVWDNKESHAASLKLPSVQQAIAKARPLIAGMEQGTTTIPVGGVGLPRD